jgi:DNA-binding NarL/FixJ family response regulator
VDIAMPLLNRLDAGRQLRQALPSCRLVYLTMSHDADVAAEALRMGAAGYLLKTSAGSELREAVDAVLRSRRYLTAARREALEERLRRGPATRAPS